MTEDPTATLQFQQPPSYAAGVFPREHLIPGEVLYWEGKPALIAYILLPLLVTILGLLLLAFEINALFMIFEFLGILGIIVQYLRWVRTSFALTNRRVLTQYGVFSTRFADCPHGKIQNTVVIKPFFQNLLGYGELIFATGGTRGGVSSGSPHKLMSSGGGVYWNGLPRPAEVKRFAEEVMEASKKQAKAQEYQLMANAVGQKKPVENKLSVEERLTKAKQMRDTNTITQEEYEQMRRNILMDV